MTLPHYLKAVSILVSYMETIYRIRCPALDEKVLLIYMYI